jgi:hypothetical protein
MAMLPSKNVTVPERPLRGDPSMDDIVAVNVTGLPGADGVPEAVKLKSAKASWRTVNGTPLLGTPSTQTTIGPVVAPVGNVVKIISS